MAREIKTVFSLDGETKYRDAIKGINKEQALLRAEMRASANAFDTSGDKQKKLTDRAESLSKQIELQKKKVAEAQNAVEQASRRYETATTKLEELRAAGKEGTDEFERQKKEVERADRALTDYKIDVASAESSLGKMQSQLASTNKEILLNESRLKKAGDAMEASGKKAEKVGKTLTTAGNKLTTGLTLPIVAVGAASVKAAIDFESAFTGVQKTVSGTEEQMGELEQGIRDMAKEIPATTTEISAVAEAAGQLGIQTDNVLEFTRVMIDLGETTNLSAEEGASSLAKFANVTQMSQKDFDRLGSTVVSLGNNMATTEADIVAMGTRLAGAGKQVGMSEAEIMSFSAALSSVGIEAEAGGSAFSKVMVEIQLAAEKGGKKLDQFASVAGMSAEEFRRKFQDDAAGAIMAFVEGLGNMEGSGQSAIGVLSEMGITEVRMRDALLRSANAGDLLAEALGLGNAAWEENNALTKEAGLRYDTTESKLKIAKNTIADAGITVGENLIPPLADLAEGVADVAEWFGKLSPEMQKSILIAMGVVAAIGPVTRTVGSLTTAYSKTVGALGKYLKKLAEKKAAEAAAAAATKATATAAAGAATATETATTATSGLSAASSGLLSPLTLVIAALAALGIAAYAQIEHVKALNKGALDAADAAAEFAEGVNTAKSALDGFDESTALTADRQSALKESVQSTQGAITELTGRAVAERRTLTEAEYKRLQELIDQLGVFAEAQIEVYDKQNRMLGKMIENEDAMTQARAQEYIKAAQETGEALIGIEDEKYTELYNQADDFDRKAAELREAGRIAEAEDWEKKADDLRARAEKEHDSEVERINRENAEILSLIQQKYMDQNAEEVKNIARLGEIQDEKTAAHEKYLADLKRISRDETTTVAQKQIAQAEALTEYQNTLRDLNAEETGLWTEKTSDVAGALAAIAADIEAYGGVQSEEAQKATDAIIGAWDRIPDDIKGPMKESLEKMIEELKEKSPDLYEEAKNTTGSFINRIEEVLYGATGTYAEAGEEGGEAYSDGLGSRRNKSSAKTSAQNVKNTAVSELEKGESEAKTAGQSSGSWFARGLKSKKTDANKAGKDVKDASLSPFNPLASLFGKKGESAGSSLAGGIRRKKSDVGTAAGEARDKAKSGLGGLLSKAKSVGKDAMQYLIDGTKLKFGALWSAAINVVNQFISGMLSPKGFWRGSPYKKMTEIAKDTVESFTGEVEKEQPKAESAGVEMARATIKGAKANVEAQQFLAQQLAGTKLASQLAYVRSGGMSADSTLGSPVSNVTKTQDDHSLSVTIQTPSISVRSEQDIKRIARELAVEVDRKRRAKGA